MSGKVKRYIEADEMRTFSGSKDNDIWIWPAAEKRTRLAAGAYIGKKDEKGAFGL